MVLKSMVRRHLGDGATPVLNRHGSAEPSGALAIVRDEAVDAGPADGLLASGRMLARFGDVEVLAVRTRRGLFAVENRCPHLGRPLSDATVSGRRVICRGHHRRYDMASGKEIGRPAPSLARLRTFDIDIIDGRVWLRPKAT